MRRVIIALIAMTCFSITALVQGRPQTQPSTASVGFHNQSEFSIIVKGYTVVNGVQRAGPLVHLKKGAKGFENNVPLGTRYYSVYDANQTSRILLQDNPVPIRNSMVLLNIVPSPTNANRVTIVPVGGSPTP